MNDKSLSKTNSSFRMLLLGSLYFKLLNRKKLTEGDMEELNGRLNLVKRPAILGLAAFWCRRIWSDIRQSDLEILKDPFHCDIDSFVELVWVKKPKLARYGNKDDLKEDIRQVVKLARSKTIVDIFRQ